MSDALRETCEHCGESVIAREPGSITLTMHAHFDDEYATLVAKAEAVDRSIHETAMERARRIARNGDLSITPDELPVGSAFRRA